jgi:hypothetical protein
MSKACSTNWYKKNVYRLLVLKSEGRRPLGRPRSRWVNNINMGLREIGVDGMDWIDLAQGPVEGSCEHGNEPAVSVNYWEVLV